MDLQLISHKFRNFQIEKLEEVAQGRVWTGKAALDRGLVDTLGGISKAVAIAKQKAGIAEDQQVNKFGTNQLLRQFLYAVFKLTCMKSVLLDW